MVTELIWRKVHGPDRPFYVEHDPPYRYAVQKRIPDVSKARDYLGFLADTPIEAVLDEVVPWVREGIESGRI